MKELVIKRTFQVVEFEPVTFEATFGSSMEEDLQSKDNIESLLGRAFNEFGMILKRAGLTDPKINWLPIITADDIDAIIKENDK